MKNSKKGGEIMLKTKVIPLEFMVIEKEEKEEKDEQDVETK
jgi:hypothetical protein